MEKYYNCYTNYSKGGHKMTKERIYIMARSGKKEDVYDAVFSWVSGFDSIEEAKKYGLNSHNKAIIEIKVVDDNIESDNDIKVVYEEA